MMKKDKFKKIAAVACTLALTGAFAFAFTACDDNKGGGGGEGPGITQGAIEIQAAKDTIKVGESTTIQVTTATTTNVTWTSSAPSVASVTPANNGGKMCTVAGLAEGETTITAKCGDYTATCKITVEPAEVLTPVDVAFSPQNEFASGWRYWAGEGTVNVSSCKTYAEKNEVTINYNLTSGLSYSVQLFYKDFKTTDVKHDVTLTVVSDVKDNITINNQKVELEEGENKNISVKGFTGSTLVVNFGVWDENIVSGTHEFTFKDIVATPVAGVVELETPSFEYAADTKVITITDSNTPANVKKYELGVFENATDELPAYTIDVTTGQSVDFDTVKTGNYVLKLRAFNDSDMVLSSPWSETTANLEWENSKTIIVYKEEADIASGSNTWYYWRQTWDDICTVSKCYLDDNDTIHVEGLTNNVGNTWSFQMYYKGTAGKKFNITVTAQNAGKITINGVVKELTAGEAVTFENVDTTYYHNVNGVDHNGVSIQFGGGASTDDNLKGNITLVIEEVQAAS